MEKIAQLTLEQRYSNAEREARYKVTSVRQLGNLLWRQVETLHDAFLLAYWRWIP